ncbi:ribosomal rRNA-processing protein 8 [Strigomonas culicis]|nr:ribosomal rRNA-processing protein 8 [Strigomonas culicis]EPY28100.1 ribosomal rRNA-processing protein 8 [Strigomonas culicis]EPY34353.1 ribosomal rRNA-processing protein 8 [Strigomonas culicis]|eukprot:EPY21305.1 ribosomal rRNA-processing protein 8 [Strigomonas culicis]
MNPNQLIVEALLGDRRGKFLNNKGKCLPGHIPPTWVIADMGCGDAQIAAALQPKGYTVHSFDFCALNERVTEADAAHVPLEAESVDICIFSLSLMATDYEKCLMEAFRILKPHRLLKVVEVRSRIPHPRKFAAMVESIGFTLDYNDVAGDYFAIFDFVKRDDVKEANSNVCYPPGEVLVPSLYKKR